MLRSVIDLHPCGFWIAVLLIVLGIGYAGYKTYRETQPGIATSETVSKAIEALTEQLRTKDLQRMANQYGNLGNIYQTRGDLDPAEETYKKALAIFKKLGRQEGMATIYGNLGAIYQTRGEIDRAEEMHKKALAIDEKLGRQEGVARQYGNLGLIYQTRGEHDRAEEMFKKALALFKAIGAAPSVEQVQSWLDNLNESRAER